MDMNEFYKLGQDAALEKLGGLLSGIGQAWRGMAPGAQAVAKRLGAGATVGGLGGALAGGPEHRTTGLLAGMGLGALGGQALGKAMQTSTLKGITGAIREGAGAAGAKGSAKWREAAQRLSAEGRPMVEQTKGMAFPWLSRVMG
jgi:hypothetical protein